MEENIIVEDDDIVAATETDGGNSEVTIAEDIEYVKDGE